MCATVVETCTKPVQVMYVPAWAPVAITPRGTAYLRLAEFADVWRELAPADRAYFAEDLRDLLVDAVLPETPRVASAPDGLSTVRGLTGCPEGGIRS